MTGISRAVRMALVVGGLIAVPLTTGSKGHLIRMNDAECEQLGGTCCDEQGSTCHPTGCNSRMCMQSNAYWNDTGQPC